MFLQGTRQPSEIGLVECLIVFIARLDAVDTQQIEADGGIGSTAVRDFISQVGDRECAGEGGFHGRLARATGADQGAINVEKKNLHTISVGKREHPEKVRRKFAGEIIENPLVFGDNRG